MGFETCRSVTARFGSTSGQRRTADNNSSNSWPLDKKRSGRDATYAHEVTKGWVSRQSVADLKNSMHRIWGLDTSVSIHLGVLRIPYSRQFLELRRSSANDCHCWGFALAGLLVVAGFDGAAAAVSPTIVAFLIWSSFGHFSARYFSPNFSMLP